MISYHLAFPSWIFMWYHLPVSAPVCRLFWLLYATSLFWQCHSPLRPAHSLRIPARHWGWAFLRRTIFFGTWRVDICSAPRGRTLLLGSGLVSFLSSLLGLNQLWAHLVTSSSLSSILIKSFMALVSTPCWDRRSWHPSSVFSVREFFSSSQLSGITI